MPKTEDTKNKEDKADKKEKIPSIKDLMRLASKRGFKLKLASEIEPFEYIPSGLPQMDNLGGPCLGRFVVIYGAEGSGKSTMAYRYITSAQKKYPEKICLLVDAEHRVDPVWMEQQGVSLERLLIIDSCDTLEEYCQAAIDIIQTGAVSLCVIDTISAMTPAYSLEEKSSAHALERDHVAIDARKTQQFIKLVTSDVFKHKTAVLIVAQTRTHGIGSMYTYEGLSGGHHQKHMALQIWQFSRTGKSDCEYQKVVIDGNTVNELASYMVRAKLEKDTGPNLGKAAFVRFRVGIGFDLLESVINAAIRFDIIKRTGGIHITKNAFKVKRTFFHTSKRTKIS